MTEEEIKEMQERLAKLEADNQAMAAKNAELLDETKQAKAKAKAEKEAAEAAAEEAARKSGDVEALDKSWQEKLGKRESELQAQIDGFKANARKTTVEAVARKIAGEISTSPELMYPHVLSRLDMAETEDGGFKTVVKDAQGQMSALSTDELAEEFKGNDAFRAIIKGTEASGGGAPGSDGKDAGKPKPGSREERLERSRKAFKKVGLGK